MPTHKQKTVRKRVLIVFFVLILVLGGFLYSKFSNLIKPLYDLTFEKKIELKKVEEQRINILLLGVGGGSHDGPYLTDTIMFASIDPEKNKVTLVSIPRDFWVTEFNAKINHVYALSRTKGEGKGLNETKRIVGDILGQKIDYGFRIDFNGFIKAIDLLGGVKVDVERTFDDYAYPINGKEDELCGIEESGVASLSAQIATGSATDYDFFPCRFEHLHFDQGLTQMTGETALKYVRSRHALGPEGTDFARSKRQENVITAIKEKVFSAQTFLNPVKIVGLVEILQGSIDMDIKEEEYDDFIKLAQKMREAKIQSIVLNADEDVTKPGLLLNPPVSDEYRFQYVLIPRIGNGEYSEIHSYVSCIIKYGDECTIPATPTLESN